MCEQWSHMTLTLTLSYDLELERQGTQGGLDASDRGNTVDDGRTDGGERTTVAVAVHVPRPARTRSLSTGTFFLATMRTLIH